MSLSGKLKYIFLRFGMLLSLAVAALSRIMFNMYLIGVVLETFGLLIGTICFIVFSISAIKTDYNLNREKEGEEKEKSNQSKLIFEFGKIEE